MGDWQAKWIEAMESARTAETWQERDSWTRYATETRLAAAAMGRSSKERAPKAKADSTTNTGHPDPAGAM